MKNGYFANGYFTLGDKGEIETNRFFRVSSDLAKILDKIIDKNEYPPSKVIWVIFIGNFGTLDGQTEQSMAKELMNLIIF